ncbi:hypothetical protein AB4501_23290, partial [Vibrio sp. 10N.222.55.E8]
IRAKTVSAREVAPIARVEKGLHRHRKGNMETMIIIELFPIGGKPWLIGGSNLWKSRRKYRIMKVCYPSVNGLYNLAPF